jgi:hypothetical protein
MSGRRSLGSAAAHDVHNATQAHPSICGQAVLSKMNLTAMGHVDIELPHGDIKPIAEFFGIIAGTGERKTSADNRAAAGVVEYQNERDLEYRKEYFQYQNELQAYEKARTEILAEKFKDKTHERNDV